MRTTIQQLEDLKEWSQDSTRYERRLAFRSSQYAPGSMGTEAGTIPIEWDELSDREREYFRTPPFVTREDYRKGQLVQPGPGRQGYKGRAISGDKLKWYNKTHFNNPNSDFYETKWEDLPSQRKGHHEATRDFLTRKYGQVTQASTLSKKVEAKGLGKNIDLLIEAYNTEAPAGPIKKKIQQKIIGTKEFKKFFTPEEISKASEKAGGLRDRISTLRTSRLHRSLLPGEGKGFISASHLAEKLGVADHTLWNSRTGAISQSELKGRAPHLGTKYPAYNYNKMADLLNLQTITVKGQKHYYFKDPGIKDMKFLKEFMKRPILQQDTVRAMNIINSNDKITKMMEKRIFPDIETVKSILKDAKLPSSDGNAATAMLRLAEVYKGGTFKNEIGIGTNKLVGNFINKSLDGYDIFHPWSKGSRDATMRIITQNMPDKAGNLQTFKTSVRQGAEELGVDWKKMNLNLNEVFSVTASKSNKAYPYAYFVDVMDAGMNKGALKNFHGSLSTAQGRLIKKIDQIRATKNPQFRKALYGEAKEIVNTFNNQTRTKFANTIKKNYPGKNFNLANIVLGSEKSLVAKDFKIPASVYTKSKLDKWATKGVNIAEHAAHAGYVMTGAQGKGVELISEFFTPESRLTNKKVIVASTLNKFLQANGVNICG